jgi:hypothetical protein
MLQVALKLAEKGMAVFACKPRDKVPATAHGCKDATRDLEQVRVMWRRYPNANIGIACGQQSNLWVLDIDGHEGEASLRAIEQQHASELPPTIEVITGNGGRHVYFRWPDFEGAPVIKNSAGQVGRRLDVRGEGGFVIAPPSVHPCGRRYAWSVDCAGHIAVAPDWLLQLVTCRKVSDLDERRPDEHWQRLIGAGADEGCRNSSAASLAGYLLRHGVKPSIALDLLLKWNTCNRPPLPHHEVARIVRSIAQCELARRQSYG